MLGLKVPVINVRTAEGILNNLRCLNKSFKPIYMFGYAYFPMTDQCSSIPKKILDKISGEIIEADFFPKKKKKTPSIKQLEDEFGYPLPKSINEVGDVILINELPHEISKKDLKVIGDILRESFSARAVFLKVGQVSGTHRVAKWERISGFGDTFTVHRENNYLYALDFSKVFFNPRLNGERKRIFDLSESREIIADLFSGIGPFSIPLSKKALKVYAFDINCDAIGFLKINMKINKVPENKLLPFCRNARDSPKFIDTPVDRIIMNYPEGAIDFLTVAISLIKPGGVIHLYTFERGDNKKEASEIAKNEVLEKIEQLGFRCYFLNVLANREVAPRKYFIVLDIKIIK